MWSSNEYDSSVLGVKPHDNSQDDNKQSEQSDTIDNGTVKPSNMTSYAQGKI